MTEGEHAATPWEGAESVWPAWPLSTWPMERCYGALGPAPGRASLLPLNSSPLGGLDPAAIHVVRLWLPDWFDCSQAAVDVLSDDERRRAGRFVSSTVRLRFVACRFALRCCLAQLLGCLPGEIQLAYGPQGKPFLIHPCQACLSFNVSHSYDWALIALSWGHEVGVDLERIEGPDTWQGIARRLLAPQEQEQLSRLPPQLQPWGFYRVWTCKEAYLKGTGHGMSVPLRSFAVAVDPREPPRLLDVPHQPTELARWQMHMCYPAQPFVAALCWEGAPVPVCCWSWRPPSAPRDAATDGSAVAS